MNTTIYCYTGTGNSLWTARHLAGRLDVSEVISLSRTRQQSPSCDSERVGLFFPVHIWGVPPPVIEFLRRLKVNPTQYIFAVAVNAGQVAATLIQLGELLHTKHLHLSSGFSIDLPSNYIPWGGAVSQEKQQKKFSAALTKIERIAEAVRNKEDFPPEKGPVWQNLIFSLIYRKSLPYVAGMDKSFLADDQCSRCGICEKICPARNIEMAGGKPAWHHRCEQCFACLQWCPEEAIQHGKNTKTKKRYHHPDISLKDMLACAPEKNAQR